MNVSKTFCAVALLLGASVNFAAFAGDKIDEVLDVSATGQVSIENMRGEVEIIGWSKSQVSISGELDDKALGYTFETENGFTIFKVKMPRNKRNSNWHRSDGSNLVIHLPIASELSFESVNGSVSITDVLGGTEAHTVNGNIQAKGLFKKVKLQTVNGNVYAKGLQGKIRLATVNGKVTDLGSKGRVRYSTVNGTVKIDSAASRVYVESVNGEIDLSLKTIEDLDVSTVNGEVDAALTLADDASISITTVSGSAYLKLAGEVGGRFRLSTHAGGRIKNKLTDDKVKKQKYGPARNLSFKIDGGSANVEMTTVSGNLTIE
jgi:hypothetical protein